MNVLIIENEEPLNNLFAKIARKQGHSVEQAFDFEDAVAALRMNKFDLICCDLDLGEGKNHGPKALLQSELHDAKILFLTDAQEYQQTLKPLEDLGCEIDCIPKPIHPNKLREFLK
jgi:DNA-binding response OmpR family regulator